MKKILSLALASLMAISVLCACGGSNEAAASESITTASTQTASATEDETVAESVTNEDLTSEDVAKLSIGDKFGTDSVECVIEDVIWFTPEDILSNSSKKLDKQYNVIRLDISSLYPEYKFEGLTGVTIPSTATEDNPEGDPYLCILYTLQNIGKVEVGTQDFRVSTFDAESYGNISVVYDNDFVFDSTLGFVSTLDVLGEPLKEGRVISLKQAVYENEDKSLELKITLPNSAGETEDFFVTLR